MDTGGYRAALEELWRRKVDQIVVLSMAYHDDLSRTLPAAPGPTSAFTGVEPTVAPRLHRLLRHRVVTAHEAEGHFRAHEDLALIEDAIDRIKAGTYGICGRCGQPICADWLNAIPYVTDCTACSLSQAHRLPAAETRTAGSPAIAS